MMMMMMMMMLRRQSSEWYCARAGEEAEGGDWTTSMCREACMTRDMAHVNVAAIVATCMPPSHYHHHQQQQPASPAVMLLYAIDSTDCHNLKLFLQRCRAADVSILHVRRHIVSRTIARYFAFTALTLKCLQRFDAVGWAAGRASGL